MTGRQRKRERDAMPGKRLCVNMSMASSLNGRAGIALPENKNEYYNNNQRNYGWFLVQVAK